jgi:hypothetical protein
VEDSKLPPWPPQPALFLDLDGTLLEFAEHPLDVVPSARLRWVSSMSKTGSADRLQPVYGISGRTDLVERTVESLPGYRSGARSPPASRTAPKPPARRS